MMPFLGQSVLVALLTLSAALDPALDTTWEDWKSLHKKEYLEEGEDVSRRAIWEDNLRMIEQHNWEASLGKHTYRLGMNHFGDMTDKEFSQKMNGFVPNVLEPTRRNVSWFHASATEEVPKSVDWRKEGYVTRVKDQGECESSWAFSATGALESLQFKKTGQRVSFSEQNLMDCSWDQGNRGCQGGWAVYAFDYMGKNSISLEKAYPYKGQIGTCHRREPRANHLSYKYVKKGDEKALEQAVVKFGPVSVTIDSRTSKFRFYRSGVFSYPWGGDVLNQAALVVGYKTNGQGKGYWIVKNSWSENWGVKGYLYLEKGSNQCGIANDANYPIL